jgi:hypothetical protein
MSGWDTPSRPTWDPQDGPEDSTQAFPAPDGSGAEDRWSQPAGSGWGGAGAADNQDFGRGDFDLADFGGLNTPAPDLGGEPGRGDRREPAFPPESNGFSSDQNGYPRGAAPAAPSSEFFTQEFEQRQPGATLAGRTPPGAGRYVSGPQASARDEPPWPGPARQESPRQESARQASARPDYGRPGEYGRVAEYGRPEPGRADLDRPGPPGAQDFPRREPGRSDLSAYSTYSGQTDQAEQAAPPSNRADADLAARMDPALQDFFAPTKPDPRYSAGRPSLGAQSPGLAGPGQPDLDRPDFDRPDFDRPDFEDRPDQGRGPQPPRRGDGRADGRGDDRGPRRPARLADPWEDPTGYPSTGPQDGQQRPRSRGGLRDDDFEPASRTKMFLAIGAVVVVVIAGGAYLLLHKSGNNNPSAGGASTPTASAAAPTATSSAKPKTTATAKSPNAVGSAASTGSYLLSTPSTAAGYPIGSDPSFLATATSTVATFEQSGIAGGAGTVAGSPVSASYTLPDAQTIEFVGYQGTFNPAKVMANLKDYGSSEATYPAGPNGGDLACANTTATASTPSGAVCVWVTDSTLGFTEFFTQADGPEALNSAQNKGAEDTVNLRASVEKLKS